MSGKGGSAHARNTGHAEPGILSDVRILTLLVLSLIAILAYAGGLLGISSTPGAAAIAPTVAYPAAFLGGLLALLSPCTAVVLPAFFAYSYRADGRLLRQSYVFFLGLALAFVPLGFASSLLAGIVDGHPLIVAAVGGGLLVLLGLATLGGFDFGRVIARLTGRDPSSVSARAAGGDETMRVLLLGAVFGITASACTAPIVGAMAALALGAGLSSLQAMLLFLVFALGIAAPLFVLSALFERYDLGRSNILRAKPWTFRALGRERAILPHDAITGALLVVLGVAFAASGGTLGLGTLLDRAGATDLYASLTERLMAAFAGWPAWLGIAAVAGAVATGALLLRRFARGSPRE